MSKVKGANILTTKETLTFPIGYRRNFCFVNCKIQKKFCSYTISIMARREREQIDRIPNILSDNASDIIGVNTPEISRRSLAQRLRRDRERIQTPSNTASSNQQACNPQPTVSNSTDPSSSAYRNPHTTTAIMGLDRYLRFTRISNELGAGNPEGAWLVVHVVMFMAVTEALIMFSGTRERMLRTQTFAERGKAQRMSAIKVNQMCKGVGKGRTSLQISLWRAASWPQSLSLDPSSHLIVDSLPRQLNNVSNL